MNESTIIKVIKNGDINAYRHLVDRYQAGVIIHCDQIVSDRDVAEDIAQDAFIRGYYQIDTFDESKAAFSTWIYSIATNLAKDHLRKNRRKRNIKDIELLEKDYPELTSAEIREIRETVSNLQPPEYGHVIKAYYWEGKRYEQIAAELNVPVGTVGTWVKRAKVQLRKELL